MGIHRRRIIYRINEADQVVELGEEWNDFAHQNDAPQLTKENIVSLPIWHFIHDPETRHFHETLLLKVRRNRSTLSVPFRCDSPAVRRYMTMNINPLPRNAVEYRCQIDRLEPREPVPLLANQTSEGETFIRMCSWCKKIDCGRNHWLEVEAAIAKLGLFELATLPRISHTICDDCRRKVMSSM